MRFKEFLTEEETLSNLIGKPLNLPGVSMEIPEMVKSGRVVIFEKHRNPIFVQLSDGTKLYFTYDELKRLPEEPKIGKMMYVTFQRHPKTPLSDFSKITNIKIN